jgi:hypothetical protein
MTVSKPGPTIPRGVQDVGHLDRAVLSERTRSVLDVLAGSTVQGRNLIPEPRHLLGGELEHEIFGKAIAVALDLFVQTLGGSAVDRSQFAIENDTLTAQVPRAAKDLPNLSLALNSQNRHL